MSNFKSIKLLTILNIINIVLGTLFVLVQVRLLGNTREIDCYFISQTIVASFLTLIQGGQIAVLFQPKYQELLNKNEIEGANKALSIAINYSFILSLFLILISIAFSFVYYKYILSGYTELEINTVKLFLYLLLPSLPLSMINGVLAMSYNARKQFGFVEKSRTLIFIFQFLILFLYYKSGAQVLIITTYFALLTQSLIYLTFIIKSKYKHSFITNSEDISFKDFISKSFHTINYGISLQIFVMFITNIASNLDPGIFSIFKYLQNMTTRMTEFLFKPIHTIYFSQLNSVKENFTELNKLLKENINLLSLTSVYIICLYLILGEEIVLLIFGQKNIDLKNLHIGLDFLIGFQVIIFMSGYVNLFSKTLIAFDDIKKQYIILSIIQVCGGLIAYLTLPYVSYFALILGNILNNMMKVIFLKERVIKTLNHNSIKELFSIKSLFFRNIALLTISFFIGYTFSKTLHLDLFLTLTIKGISTIFIFLTYEYISGNRYLLNFLKLK